MSSSVLTELTWKTVQQAGFDVAILPWGATEAHNYHLPYGTDNFQVEHIAAAASKRANATGAKSVVLPNVPFGVNCQQQDIPLTMNLNPSTQALLLDDIVKSVENSGITKLVILNGHGGNDFKQMIREQQAQTSVFLCAANWYSWLDPTPYFDEPGDHAGELETSVMMHIQPGLVGPLEDAGDGHDKKFVIPALRERKVWAPRQWTSVTEDTGVGNPSHASEEKGAAFCSAVVNELSSFLVDLANADLKNMYA